MKWYRRKEGRKIRLLSWDLNKQELTVLLSSEDIIYSFSGVLLWCYFAWSIPSLSSSYFWRIRQTQDSHEVKRAIKPYDLTVQTWVYNDHTTQSHTSPSKPSFSQEEGCQERACSFLAFPQTTRRGLVSSSQGFSSSSIFQWQTEDASGKDSSTVIFTDEDLSSLKTTP